MSARLLNELKYRQLGSVTLRAVVTLWEKQGIPKSRIPYFKLKFPDLDIWK